MKLSAASTRLTLAAAALAASGLAQAADINSLGNLSQADFRLLSKDIGAAVTYKGLVPAEGLGITGFDIGLGAGVSKIRNPAVLKDASSGVGDHSTLPLASLRVHKGLPFDIDLGASLTTLPGTNIRATGGEIRWAFVPGGVAMPALALRASGSFLSGVNQLKVRTTGVDLSISKGFLMLTPYAGIGTVAVKSTPDVAGLQAEKFNLSRSFVGLNVNLGLVNLAIEGDKTGDASSYSAKFGVRF
ncbi:MAG: hypothetical protein RL722_2313 [Pseudomonadota bacterium]|jgi:hypothetical protein